MEGEWKVFTFTTCFSNPVPRAGALTGRCPTYAERIMRCLGAAIGFLALGLAGRAFAVVGLVDVSDYDRSSGQVLAVYTADGQRYVAGRPCDEYEVRIRNNTSEDILAVVSVDGVNVITGE